MIEVVRQDHPGLRFEVGSTTELALTDESVTGAGFTVEAEMAHHPAPGVEGGFVFAHRAGR